MLDCRMVSRCCIFHMGSADANLAELSAGFREAIRYLGELRALGLPVESHDVGGGLGVDYDGNSLT